FAHSPLLYLLSFCSLVSLAGFSMGSFLLFIHRLPLFSSKSVASFFQKLSAVSHQPSASRSPRCVLFFTFAICLLPFLSFLGLRPSGPPHPQNGGFVPRSLKGRSFVINQIGGFVFQKLSALSPQLSAQRTGFLAERRLLTAERERKGVDAYRRAFALG